ncbi:MAG: hypothetical protein HZY73_11005 [Micropruina sp.]|nr:MAG: hypothetical protein HZY73_11005 [Micropruina sp.]
MTAKTDWQAARDAVAAYHEAELARLVAHVASAVDQFRSGELDAFEADHAIFQYSRSAKALWKFCNLGDPQLTAALISDRPTVDWWQRGAPKEP